MIDLRLGRWQDVLRDDPADGTVRLILTSPPYDNARTYEGTNEPVDFGELAAWCIRKLMPGGVMAMVLDGAVNDGAQSVSHLEVAVAWSRLEGWRFLQQLTYGRQGAPGEYKGRFRKDGEPLFVFVRDGAPHVCEKERIANQAKTDMRRAVGFAGNTERDGTTRVFGVRPNGAAREVRDIQHRGSLWWYGMVGHGQDPSADTGHPATFAERFALDAVDVWSNPGDLVIDPFAGSFTVGRACQLLGRRCVGSERVGPCPQCGGGFPERCEHNWLNYHAIGLRRVRDPETCEAAARYDAAQRGQALLFGGGGSR